MTLFTKLWILWIAAGIALEIAALVRPAKGDTLSEHAWHLYQGPLGQFFTFMGTAFLVWLAWHFAIKGTWK